MSKSDLVEPNGDRTNATMAQRPIRASVATAGLPIPSTRSLPTTLSIGASALSAVIGKAYLILVLGSVVVVGALLSPYFLSAANVRSTLISTSSVMILAVGQFLVIVTGGIDLSVGSVAALSSVIVALLLGHGFLLATLAALGVGALVGLLNGLTIVYGGITPFIVTLGTLEIGSGLAYTFQTGDLIQITNNHFILWFTGSFIGIPSEVLIAFIVTLIAAFLMSGTVFGRNLYAIGGNAEASRLSGLPVKRSLVEVYVISGLLAGLAGVIISAQLAEGSALIGQNYELDAIAAAVVGGASLFGGTGDPIGAVIGAIVIGAITDIMDLRGMSSNGQLLVEGLVILVAVFFVSGKGSSGIRTVIGKVRRSPDL